MKEWTNGPGQKFLTSHASDLFSKMKSKVRIHPLLWKPVLKLLEVFSSCQITNQISWVSWLCFLLFVRREKWEQISENGYWRNPWLQKDSHGFPTMEVNSLCVIFLSLLAELKLPVAESRWHKKAYAVESQFSLYEKNWENWEYFNYLSLLSGDGDKAGKFPLGLIAFTSPGLWETGPVLVSNYFLDWESPEWH